MDLGLAKRTALVTGSTAGIGRAIARELLLEGATVVINGRDPGRTRQATDELAKDTGGRAIAVAGDVSTSDGAREFLALLARESPPIDVLVNNAGVFEPKPFADIADDEWMSMFEVNVVSGIRLSRALVPRMVEGGYGRVIFISSESGLSIPEEMIHYGVSKTAQLAVVRGLAKSLRGTGVTVNAVLPGPTWTEGVADFVAKMAAQEGVTVEEMRETFVAKHRPASLIRRFAEPAEVAAMVAYAVSDRASATTGAALKVEGGLIDSIG
ncbi:MAG: SDR family oxidoreductase [Planctomycetes bacterium]|nr:SDR family oxidoreductase [Planctomycetota bacterium]